MVIGDGPQPKAGAIARGLHPQIEYLEYGPTRLWGHPQRNWVMSRAKGTHLYFCDDDDEILPGALDIMRRAASEGPDKINLLRVYHADGVIPRDPYIVMGNVSTQCFLVPNIPSRLGVWGDRNAGDLDFLESSIKKHPLGVKGVVWRQEMIALHGIGGTRPPKCAVVPAFKWSL